MKLSTIRETLSMLNYIRGRGDIITVKFNRETNTGTAKRKRQYGGDTIKFRAEKRPGGMVRVFALGSSRVSE